MPRRNQGPRLRWLDKRKSYVTWTEHGRSRKRSTGTADRAQAEIAFAEWLHARGRRDGPSDPAEILVTDILNSYALERGPKVVGRETLGRAVENLAAFWEGKTVSEITPQNSTKYAEARGVSAGTIRRELSVLQAAINYGHRHGKLTRSVGIELPQRPPSRERWLTRKEAARLIRSARTPRSRVYLPLFIWSGG